MPRNDDEIVFRLNWDNQRPISAGAAKLLSGYSFAAGYAQGISAASEREFELRGGDQGQPTPRINWFEPQSGGDELFEPIHEVEEWDIELLKEQIKNFFEANHGKEIDYLDLAEVTNLPLPIIVKVCEELEREGKIAAVN